MTQWRLGENESNIEGDDKRSPVGAKGPELRLCHVTNALFAIHEVIDDGERFDANVREILWG